MPHVKPLVLVVREKERDRIYEKKLLKERELEDKEFADQPKFMTSAYKQKLIEDKKWAYENMLADKLDEKTDVRSGGMEGFYKNLLTKNISMGSSVDGNAISVYTAGSMRNSTLVQADAGKTTSSSSSIREDERSSHFNFFSAYLIVIYGCVQRLQDQAAGSDQEQELRIADEGSRADATCPPLPSLPLPALPIDIDSPSSSHPPPQPNPTPALSKEEAIQLARQRYLERKRKIGST